MSAKTGDIVPGAACPKKYSCIPFAKGCSGQYCQECRRHDYLYYFNKRWRERGVVEHPKAFNEQKSHPPIVCGSGRTFGWGEYQN